MKCPTCGKDNDEQALFCDECGTTLAAKSAGKQSPPDVWIPARQPRQRVCGVVKWIFAILMLFGGVWLCLPLAVTCKRGSLGISCASNLKQLSLGFLMYAQDWEENPKASNEEVRSGTYPPARAWMMGILPYVRTNRIFFCPNVSHRGAEIPEEKFTVPTVTDYGFNSALSGFPSSRIEEPAFTVLLFESSGFRFGRAWGVVNPGRHNGGNVFAFADGHIKFFEGGKTGSLLWSPMERSQQ